jgi:aerobic carbon-monoxide dehydrogenase medium subunit
MKIPKFVYHRPATTEETLDLLSAYGDDAKVLAGGQSLIPLMALRLSYPAHLIDIGAVRDLPTIRPLDGVVSVGALVRHAEVEHSPIVAAQAPMVTAAMPHIGHRAIRNRGTACGSLAHADPAAELPAVALAAGAELVLRRAGGQRSVPAADFFHGYLTSDVAADELLTEWRLPPWPPTAGWSVQEVSRRHGDYALLGMASAVDFDDRGRISAAALAFFGAASVPVRVEAAEKLLLGQMPGAELFDEAAAVVKQELDPPADLHGTAAYRKHLGAVLTKRCLVEASGRVGAVA